MFGEKIGTFYIFTDFLNVWFIKKQILISIVISQVIYNASGKFHCILVRWTSVKTANNLLVLLWKQLWPCSFPRLKTSEGLPIHHSWTTKPGHSSVLPAPCHQCPRLGCRSPSSWSHPAQHSALRPAGSHQDRAGMNVGRSLWHTDNTTRNRRKDTARGHTSSDLCHAQPWGNKNLKSIWNCKQTPTAPAFCLNKKYPPLQRDNEATVFK